MIRRLNLVLAVLAALAALLWQLPAEGGQLFKIAGHRIAGVGQDPALAEVRFDGWLNVLDDSSLAMKTTLKFDDEGSPRFFDGPIRLNLADALPNGLDIRNYSNVSNQDAVFMIDPVLGADSTPLALTGWNEILQYYTDGTGGSITSAIPVTEPSGPALLAVGGFILVVTLGRLMTGDGPRRGMIG